MNTELQHAVVLVAGSTRGIGLAISRAFLAEGSRVVITGRNQASLDEAEPKDRLLALQGDMSIPAEIRRIVDRAEQVFGPIGTAVLNVGSGVGPTGWDIEPEQWQASINQNLLAGMAAARAVLPSMIARKTGTIIFIGSIAGLEAIGAPTPYSWSKMSLVVMAKQLARQVGPQGIRVNCVAPGNIIFPGGRWAEKRAEAPADVDNYIAREVPLQRFGRPEEIADAVVFLASSRAAFITGACLVVDGGQTRGW